MQFATVETLVLSPLPCWKHLPVEMRRRLIAELIADIDREVALRREQTGNQVLVRDVNFMTSRSRPAVATHLLFSFREARFSLEL